MIKKSLSLLMIGLLVFAFACSKSESTKKAAPAAKKMIKSKDAPYEGKIKLTSVTEYGKYGKSIVLNDIIEIKNVQIKKNRKTGEKFVAFPRRQKKYSYAKIKRNAKALGKSLAVAIESEKVATEFTKDLAITDVRINARRDQGSFRGFAKILIENSLTLDSFKILESKKDKSLWVASPSQKKPKWSKAKGEYENIIYLKDKAFSDKVQKAVLDKYNKK